MSAIPGPRLHARRVSADQRGRRRARESGKTTSPAPRPCSNTCSASPRRRVRHAARDLGQSHRLRRRERHLDGSGLLHVGGLHIPGERDPTDDHRRPFEGSHLDVADHRPAVERRWWRRRWRRWRCRQRRLGPQDDFADDLSVRAVHPHVPRGQARCEHRGQVDRDEDLPHRQPGWNHDDLRRPETGEGRARGRSCVKRTTRLRRARSCTRYVAVGKFKRTGTFGANSFRFTGRIGGKTLKPGRYRLVATPRNTAGKVGKALTVGFRIIK